MNCECQRNLEETSMKMHTENKLSYIIFICQNCKRYYIKRLFRLIEVEYDAQGKWHQVNNFIEIDENSMEKTIQEIAKNILSIDTLESRNSDSLDFYDLAVWNIKEALEAAYQAGQDSK